MRRTATTRRAVAALAAAAAAAADPSALRPTSIKSNSKTTLTGYHVLGPFACGKDEVEGSPWEAVGAAAVAAAAPRLDVDFLLSELVAGGRVRAWRSVGKNTDGTAIVAFDDVVDWQGLVNGLNGHEVLEWQARPARY